MTIGRVVAGFLGLFLILYWIGASIGNALAGQFHWRTVMFPIAGVILGSLFVGLAIWGGGADARAILLRALLTGLAVAALGAIPGLVVLGFFLGGVAPHVATALVLIPSLFVIGAVLGGTVAYRRQRRVAPPPARAY